MTLKRPKDKGTRFETWCVERAKDMGLEARRMPASSRYDIDLRGSTGRTIDALVAKADFGPALATIEYRDLLHLLAAHGDGAHIECKRLAKVALHTTFQDKFQ